MRTDMQTISGLLSHQDTPASPAGIPPAAEPDRRRQREESRNWQAAACATYASTTADGYLRRRLVERLHALTGNVVAEETITADCDARRATAVVEGVVFRLYGRELVVVRPCAYCETGRFESQPIESRSDLGHALAGWDPYHYGCEPADPPDDASW